MAFDQGTRNRLQRFVNEVRSLLTEEFTRQLQRDFGMDPKTGEVADIAKLSDLDDSRLETARVLRQVFAHYLATESGGGRTAEAQVLDRIVREQAFTVLNRLAALRMAEARRLLVEFQLQGGAQGDARRQPGAAQQSRTGGAQPVFYSALRRGVPGRQHLGQDVVQRRRWTQYLA